MNRSKASVLLVVLAMGIYVAFCRTAHASQKIPFPKEFPKLSRNMAEMALDSPLTPEPKVRCLIRANHEVLRGLLQYTPDSLASSFGEQMDDEKNVHMKLFLAAVAAEYGNSKARHFLEKMSDSTDYEIVRSRTIVLRSLINAPQPQEWIFDAIYKTLGDRRSVTGIPKYFQSGTQFEVSTLANQLNLTGDLGAVKNPRSVPVLMELLRRPELGSDPLLSLGQIGDARALPVVLELFRKEEADLKLKNWSTPSQALIRALGGLKARAAVPTLLTYLHSGDVITALGEIGDERAIEPLRRIADSKGWVESDPRTHDSRFNERYFEAKVALIKLEPGDRVSRLLALLEDPEFAKDQWRVLDEIEGRKDVRLIAPMLAMMKSNTGGGEVARCIAVIAKIPDRDSVSSLIDCLDWNFSQVDTSGRALTPANLRSRVVQGLFDLTGEDLGDDKSRWVAWWEKSGSRLEGRK